MRMIQATLVTMNIALHFSPELADQIRGIADECRVSVQPYVPNSSDSTPKVLLLTEESFNENDIQSAKDVMGVYAILQKEPDWNQMSLSQDQFFDYSIGKVESAKLLQMLRTAEIRIEWNQLRKERDQHLHKLKELNQIGIALSTEKDPDTLLEMILSKSREITNADGGSLYLVESEEDQEQKLRFKISQNDSLELNYEEFTMAISKASIAGYVAATGETLNVPDVYKIDESQEYRFNPEYDRKTGYRSVSMLVVPMKNHRGDIIGVIQLINRKKAPSQKLRSETYSEAVIPFDKNDEDLVSSLASQAAVALENNTLIKSVQRLFEGFVTASVTAIESRDPTTSGHSFRVANLTVGLAILVDREQNEKLKHFKFTHEEITEMRYAALLHDFGKVGVRENVLVKAKKLYPPQMELIRQRFDFIRKSWEADFYRSALQILQVHGPERFEHEKKQMEETFQKRLGTLDEYLNIILQSNEPSVLPEGNFDRLLRIASDQELLPSGSTDPLLSAEEVQFLSIRKGNLNELERQEIQSHVIHTFLFLSKIPWTPELKRVPDIAHGHHEKLNGTGYPKRLSGEQIPVQTRIMTISDIYDALTASDRPYKRAVKPSRALDILEDEVRQNQLDPDLFRLFVDGKVYELATGRND